MGIFTKYAMDALMKTSHPEIDRRLTAREYDRVLDWLDCMGIENGFVQELSSAKEEYTPDFSLQGV